MGDTHMSDDGSVSEASWITLNVSHRNHNYEFTLQEDATVADLFDEIEASLDIPVSNQKIIAPKCPLLKPPFKEPVMLVRDLKGKPLKLLGAPSSEVAEVQVMAERVAKRNAARMAARATARPMQRKLKQTQYTFLKVKPLQGLPNPERSQKLLMRLKEDPGIQAAMLKHKFTVALLTEMEPLSNTQSNHEGTSRILGLNRNKGDVIELRLRTDAYDGYRDYKTIRKTLCHELAHNVHSPHDRNFWDLCHQIEREVDAADWKSGGHTISQSSRYAISGQANYDDEEEEHHDEGGWVGGEFVLGGTQPDPSEGLSRREVLAQAALQRQHRIEELEREACQAAFKGPKQKGGSPPGDERK